MGQLALEFAEARQQREKSPRLTIAERFERWIGLHPEVYDLFKRYAFEARARGRRRYSAKAIIEIFRWNEDLDAADGGFKCNDHYTRCLAEKLIEEHPEFKGFFKQKRRDQE